MLPQCLSALGPTRPVTLFTFVVLLSCVIFSFFGLCLKKLQPRKPSSYQVSAGSRLSCSPCPTASPPCLSAVFAVGSLRQCLAAPPAAAGDPQSIISSRPPSPQMSDQSEGAFNDVERSSVSSTPNSNVSTPPQPHDSSPTLLSCTLTSHRPLGQLFVATVLQEPELSLTPAASPAHQCYGTMGNHLEPVEDGEDGGLQSFETELETVEGEYRSGPVTESQARYQ